ncbi:transcription factor ETV6-like isoform X2 [Bolinopsis microptera]|uniref:transcription factor ETV6-like isoform X2 n=1 Tax=Bolinopsis microptera TaxID=2820187 RepID=UPI003078C8E1
MELKSSENLVIGLFLCLLVLHLLHKLIMSYGNYNTLPHEEDQQIPPMERRQILGGADQFPHEVVAVPRSSCQMVNPGPNNPCFVAENPVRDLTRSPLRKKPHIQKEEHGGPQGCFIGPEFNSVSCNFEEEEQPSGSSSDQGRRNITMADLLLSGEIPFSPLERPNTEAARIFYNAPDTPPILPIDPYTWSVAEVMLWLRWCSRKYEIPNIDPHMFGFNGKAICVMTKAMFEYRVPQGRGALILYTEIKNRKKHAAVQKQANELRHRRREERQRHHEEHQPSG